MENNQVQNPRKTHLQKMVIFSFFLTNRIFIELSSDETLEPSSLSMSRDNSEGINYDLYQQYGEYIVNIQEELSKEGNFQVEENIEEDEDEEEEYEEDDLDFDPFQFIAQLPNVSELEKRPILLPPKPKKSPRMTLVLDLDETLVHCSTENLAGAELTFPVIYGGREYQVTPTVHK
jgi:HD-GYP domain-containing protein (c-di-GMP phosphodiesterase class II)